MRAKAPIAPPLARVVFSVIAASMAVPAANAAEFDWTKFQGKTVTFLANNNPVSQALLAHKADFEKLTGITLKVDGYQEQQMRQRLVTVMNAHSDEVDVFMTLPSREGQQFAAAGWYADLASMAKGEVAADYDAAGLSRALLKAGTFDGKLTSMPMNIEGPFSITAPISSRSAASNSRRPLGMSRRRRRSSRLATLVSRRSSRGA